MADPKRDRDTGERLLPRREDEGTRREAERRSTRNPARHEQGDAGREKREVRPL